MKKIDLNFGINDLDGNELVKANKLFANALMNEKKGEAVKLFDWAMTLNKEGIISVDESDFNKIKEIAESSETLAILSKAQLLKYLATVK